MTKTSISQFLLLLATCSGTSAVAAQPRPQGLNSLFTSKGKLYFGTASDVAYWNDTKYLSILDDVNEFGQVTAENSMKFDQTEPTQGNFTFDKADKIVKRAQAAGQKLRCHNLLWHNGLPDWITSNQWDRDSLISVMETHIDTVVTHFKGQCYAWDVVNEAVDEFAPTGMRESIWHQIIGPEYVAMAFNFAAKYDPNAKLYYNDYGIEYANNKTDLAFELIRGLKEQGVRVDGVGLQAHFPDILAPTYDQQVENLRRFAGLGVEVAYTELDVFVMLNTTDFSRQTEVYANTSRACLDLAECVGITVWGFYDPYSWVTTDFGVPGFGFADLWWANYTEKEAYDAILKL